MKKSKIIIDPHILNKIAGSNKISNSEKINFLKYVGYMTQSEKRELATTI